MKLKESEMFDPVKKLLLESMGCEEVYAEVQNVDVLGLSGAVNIIVEMKTSLNFKLLDQVLDRRHQGHYLYIAFPERKGYLPHSVRQFLTANRIGVIEVYEKYGETFAGVSLPARFNRLALNHKRKGYGDIRDAIQPFHRNQKGGVKSGEAVTLYSNTIDTIKRFMKFRKQWVTVDEILEHCETHYTRPKPSTLSTLQAHWNSDWVEVKKEGRKTYFKYKALEGVK